MLNFLGNLISTGVNAGVACQNLQFQKENLEYQKKLQSLIFQREDNAIQRRVADLEAAGLSPTLAAGQGANAGQAVSTQAPQNQFQMAMNLLPQVGSMIDTFQRLYNAKWYAQAGLPIGYNPSDLGSAFMMSMIGGKGDRLVDNSWSSLQRIFKALGINLPNLDSVFDSGSNGSNGSSRGVGNMTPQDIANSQYRAMATRGDSGGYNPSGSNRTYVPEKKPYQLSGYDKLYSDLRRMKRSGVSKYEQVRYAMNFLGRSSNRFTVSDLSSRAWHIVNNYV